MALRALSEVPRKSQRTQPILIENVRPQANFADLGYTAGNALLSSPLDGRGARHSDSTPKISPIVLEHPVIIRGGCLRSRNSDSVDRRRHATNRVDRSGSTRGRRPEHEAAQFNQVALCGSCGSANARSESLRVRRVTDNVTETYRVTGNHPFG